MLIVPFDPAMARRIDSGWLQWGPEECIVIPFWMYALLGLAWPVLKLFYRRSLVGQHTDY